MQPQFVNIVAALTAGVALMGLFHAGAGWLQLKRSLARRGDLSSAYPPVTVLKPLHGDEPLLEQALESFCSQDYAALQIVFGLQDPNDPALAVIKRLVARFPNVEINVVVNGASHGVNRKISNLINMLPFARHDTLLIADSDMHVARDYVRQVVDTLGHPGTGLVTSLYSGLAAFPGIAGKLGAAYINHFFTPGALVGRSLGRRDCLGATMALRRQTLNAVGGLEALVNHLADDAMLGRLITTSGLRVALAPTMPATTVAERTVRELFSHELRWARTIRCVAPVGFVLSSIQYSFVWSGLSVVLSGAALWSTGVLTLIWFLRYTIGHDIDRRLGLTSRMPAWLPFLRDCLSAAVMVASYTSTSVAWRGHVLTSSMRPTLRPATAKFAPGKG